MPQDAGHCDSVVRGGTIVRATNERSQPMIQQVVTLIAAGAFAASLAGPALAQTPAAPAKPDATKPDKMDKMDKADKAAKPAKAATKTASGKVKKVSEGELVVVVTPKGKDAEDVTFIV